MAHRDDTSDSKVRRLIAEYGLENIGEELERRWTRTDDRYSLRKLASYFNRQLLETAISRQMTVPPEQSIETLYRHLTDDDVSSGVRTQTRARLEREGINVDELTDDFVSRQAIHTYLTAVRGASAPEDDRTPAERRESKLDVIQRLKQRLVVVTEQALTDLARAGHLTLGDFDVFVHVQVYCSDCATQRSVTDLFTRGGCDCGPSVVSEEPSR